jgi:hypothetical protein
MSASHSSHSSLELLELKKDGNKMVERLTSDRNANDVNGIGKTANPICQTSESKPTESKAERK